MTQETISPQAMKNAMHEAAARLLLCQPSLRAHWVAYLLECLDTTDLLPDDSDFRKTLRVVRDTIDIRLIEGLW